MAVNWLQGAKGAGYAARKKFVNVMTQNTIIRIEPSKWDPSIFMHTSSRGLLRFALHGDDGCGGWATSQSLIDDLLKVLKENWGQFKDIKAGPWKKQLGFQVTRDQAKGTTTITAQDYIERLRPFVENDLPYTPQLPCCKAIAELEVGEEYEQGTEEYDEQQRDVTYMRTVAGHLLHIGKVRHDIITPTNMATRYSHRPDKNKKGIHVLKHIIYYLLQNAHIGLTFGRSPSTTRADLQWTEEDVDKFDGQNVPLEKAFLPYFVICDGALSLTDRSRSGIIHLFAGVSIHPQSFNQHSAAVHAHDSEVFTASTACAQTVPLRGILTELEISQAVRTPIFIDSRSTLLVARSRAAVKKSMYLMRRILYMQEGVDDKEFDFFSCAGNDNHADSFTKPILQPTPFFKSRNYFMNS